MTADLSPYDHFTVHRLDESHVLWETHLPAGLRSDKKAFDALWDLHPEEYHSIDVFGPKKTPRWQQAYDRDYVFSNSKSTALPLPPEIEPFRIWAREEIDARLNGILLNWYDGSLGHKIGKHRDSINGLIPGSPIVTISLGETRTFRMRPWRKKETTDFTANDGTVFVMPFDTNRAWTHEVPASRKHLGRRISVTVRAFED